MVVRLKGGDPFVFGRGSEEVAACRAAQVPCTVVPGVTSAIAAPAAAGIPVTARGVSRSFAVLTARTEAEGGVDPAVLSAAAVLDTVVILMGRAALGQVVAGLRASGRSADTPAAAIERGTTSAQRVTRATLGTLEAAVVRDGLKAPMVAVVGEVAALGASDVEAQEALEAWAC